MKKNNRIQLSDHFTYKKLLLFTLGPIFTMIFTSLYTIVDGYFVSNYAGATPFAALNLVVPYIMIIAAIGFMFGSGGAALVAFYAGKGDHHKANSSFSLIVIVLSVIGFVCAVFSYALFFRRNSHRVICRL